MLTRLSISNLALVSTAEISFGNHLIVVTGETGSGKSALLLAISMLMGEKASQEHIRAGCEKARIEANFDIHKNSDAYQLLQEAGIDISEEDDLIIRRDIFQSGKNRAFINNQAVQLSFLKKLAHLLIDISSQHAHTRHLQKEQALLSLDAFLELEELRKKLAQLWQEYHQKQRKIDSIRHSAQERARTIDMCQLQIEEITQSEQILLEEDTIEEAHKTLIAAESNQELFDEIISTFNSNPGLLKICAKQKNLYQKLVKSIPELSDSLNIFEETILQMQECAYQIEKAHTRYEYDPILLAETEKKLSTLFQLKRKYGKNHIEILEWRDKQKEQVGTLQAEEESLELLEQEAYTCHSAYTKLAKELSEKRIHGAVLFAEQVLKLLRQLNMKKALFSVQVLEKEPTDTGIDDISFLLSPNPGEKAVFVHESASGGELARVVLAIQTVLSECENISILVFDEIDANIGGETAQKVGEMLKKLAKHKQIITVTHFPQVAIHADTHIRVRKETENDRTYTFIETLDSPEKKNAEITRMLGGTSIIQKNMTTYM